MTVEAPVADILDYAIGGGWGKEEPDQAHTLPVYVLRGTDMPNVTLGDLSTLPYRYENEKKGLRRALLPNDIVLEISGGSSARGQSTGRTVFITEAILKELAAPLIPASFCRLLRIKAEVANPRYVYYCLQEMYNSGRAATYEVQSTGISNFQFKYFLEAELVPLPSLTEQEAIAEILGALDDKIELNRKMNATLDELARTIFRSWFVDFDPVRAKMEGREPFGMDAETAALFPDRLVDSPVGPIPEGWNVLALDGIADFLNGLALQKYPPRNDASDLPVIKIAQLRVNSTVSSDKANSDVPSKYVVEDGDLLFSWSGSLIADIWTGGRGALNQHLFKVTSDKYPQWFVYHWVQEHIDHFRGIAADKATTMGHINRRHLNEAKCAVPEDNRLLEAGAKAIGELMALAFHNDLESRTLAELRDTLLPELISGRIRVPDAEKVVAEVV